MKKNQRCMRVFGAAAAGVCAVLWCGAVLAQESGRVPSNRVPPGDQPAPSVAPVSPAPQPPVLVKPAPAGIVITAAGRQAAAAGIRFLGEEVEFRDADGRTATAPLARLHCVLMQAHRRLPRAADAAAPPELSGLLVLRSGERLVGSLAAGRTHPDGLVWRSALLGFMGVVLEDVASVQMATPRALGESFHMHLRAAAQQIDDEALLTNGDRLMGFAEALDATLSISVEGTLLHLASERVARLVVSNEPPEEEGGAVVWLVSGDALRVRSVRQFEENGRRRLELARVSGERLVVAYDAVIAVTSSFERFEALAAAAREEERPHPQRWTPEPTVVLPSQSWIGFSSAGVSDVSLPGATTVSWTLPRGAQAIAMRAELAEAAREFGGAQVTVWVDREEVWKSTLDEATPWEVGVFAARGSELIVTVTAREGGPGQAIVTLVQPTIVMGAEGAAP
ncbi:MAG: hypothetical protein VYC34_03425, partial [Planctomycetota bacterium]|nr:hypothetical protein [Planctomycetota bacterium]